jgi:hypothetical protein
LDAQLLEKSHVAVPIASLAFTFSRAKSARAVTVMRSADIASDAHITMLE